MTRQKIYWICQWAGWSLYGLVNVFFVISFTEPTPGLLAANFVVSLTGIGITHAFRAWIHRKKWLEWPLLKTALWVPPASFTMALGLEMCVHLSSFVFPKAGGDMPFNLIMSVLRAFNFTVVFFSWSIIYFGVHYFQNYRKAEIEKLKLQSALKESELLALKSQMNPHFLFNALNTIRALVISDSGKAQEAVTRLANILRYALQSGSKETVSLQEEMQIVRDYLELESLRFEERLQWQVAAVPESLAAPVPAMMVQTLVENGIKHGIGKLTGGGSISVRAFTAATDIIIEVLHDGKLTPQNNGTGLGLANVRQRLQLLYGGGAKFELYETNGRVKAEIRITKKVNA